VQQLVRKPTHTGGRHLESQTCRRCLVTRVNGPDSARPDTGRLQPAKLHPENIEEALEMAPVIANRGIGLCRH
jgi:hypothetical protein